MMALVARSRAVDHGGDGVPMWKASGAPGTVVGPSAMLEWQRRGAPVFDARKAGRFVSHTTKASPSTSVPQDEPILVIAGSREKALQVSRRALWVPAGLLEIPVEKRCAPDVALRST
jgi:hypothetical protein